MMTQPSIRTHPWLRPAVVGFTWCPALASLVLFVAIVVQLWLGFAGRVDLHVPLGVAIFGLTIGLLASTRRAAIPKAEAA